MTVLVRRSGVTLIELLVTVVLLGIIASVATLSARRMDEPSEDDPVRMIGDSLRVVVATGRAATLRFVVNGEWVLATIHPDGSVVADSIVPVDRLSAVPGRGP